MAVITRDIFSLSVSVVLVAVYMITMLRASPLKYLGAFLRAFISRCISDTQMLIRHRRKCSDADPMHVYLARQLQLRSQARMKEWCCIFAHLYCSGAVFRILDFLFDQQSLFSFGQDVIDSIAFALILLFCRLCSFERSAHVYTCYSFILGCDIAWYQYGRHSLDAVLYGMGFSTFSRLMLAATCPDARFVAFTNFIFSGCAFVRYMHLDFNDTGWLTFSTLAQIEIGVFVALVVVAAQIEKSTYKDEYDKACEKSKEIEHSATSMLLEAVCDVTCPLDSDFKIDAEAPKLSAMLMIGDGKSIKGRNLETFMASEEDRTRFRSQLAAFSQNAGSLVRSVHVDMRTRDGSGSLVGVEILSYAYLGLDSSQRYMVGLREINDMYRPNPRAAETQEAEQVEAPTGQRQARDEDDQNVNVIGVPAREALARTPFDAGRDGASGSSSSSRCESSHQVVVPGNKPTTSMAIRRSLLELLISWNIAIPKKSCCSFHAYLIELRRLTKAYARTPCVKDLHSDVKLQCSACGLLDSLDIRMCCQLCGHKAKPHSL